jgi:hypothetical protein
MAEKDARKRAVMVNRAPVLTLWAAVVAEVLGVEHHEALSFGRAVPVLNAYSKGVSIGLFQTTPAEVKEQCQKMCKEETVTVDLLHRAVPAKYTDEGLRAFSGDSPIHPESVQKYLESKFRDALDDIFRRCWSSRSLCRPLSWRKKPMPGTRNFGRRSPRAEKGGGPPARVSEDMRSLR